MKKFKFAIIGCGRISFKHIEAIVNNRKDAELIAVCDIVEEKALEKSKEYKKLMNILVGPKVYVDYKKMLAESEIDIVTIAAESGYHAEIAIYCMSNGKHVIVEKPMALSIIDADNMIECGKENNVKLCVCLQNRFNPSIQRLRDAVEKGRFGKIINGTARILWNRNMDYYKQANWRGTWQFDGGTLMNQCIHNVDLLQWMLGGEVDSVYSQCYTFLRDIEVEDFGTIIIKFKNNAIGIVEGSACVFRENLKETLDIFGEKGTVCIGGLAVNNIETWKFADNNENEETIMREVKANLNSVYGDGHIFLFKDMIDALRKDDLPIINGEEGKKALSIILAAYKSSLTGEVIKFPFGNFSTMDMSSLG
ncbi:MAG: Gfo/Idh/MocA family protein [Sedimentibacter sp.]